MKKKLLLLFLILAPVFFVHAQWQLTGNSISSTDFLGSTNAQPLIFKTNNSRSGLIDYDNTKANTIFGYQAFLSSTGIQTTAFGYQALYSNTTANYNDAFGYNALYSNTTGDANSAFGRNSLLSNTTGYNNCALGLASLNSNTTGRYNMGCGIGTLYNNTTGSFNTAVGLRALNANTTTSELTAVGFNALYSNTIGAYNTAVGFKALYWDTSGSKNTATGYQALYSNTRGNFNVANGHYALYQNSTGSDNTAVGLEALSTNTTGSDNTAIGWGALVGNSTGEYNTAVGSQSLQSNTTGNFNTSVGFYSLHGNGTGGGNTGIGDYADVNASNYINCTMLGANTTGTASNQVRIGDMSVTSIGGYANWTNISDKRVKKNIKANVPGLDFINKLVPVTYNLDIESSERIIQPNIRKDKDGEVLPLSKEQLDAKKQKEHVIYTGFIAQEVEEAAKSINFDFSGIDKPKNDKDLYGLRYSDFVVPLVKAVQELSADNCKLKLENAEMHSQLIALEKRISALELLQQKNPGNPLGQSVTINDIARLEQNAPNPFNSNTIIRYNVPQNINRAQIVITDLGGHNLETISLNSRGSGQVTITAGTLASGNYIYSLIIDGKKIDSKQMILTK